MLTRRELDQMGCGREGCCEPHGGELFFHSRCHPDEPTWAVYNRERGCVTILCAKCEWEIATIQVAEGEADPLAKELPHGRPC